MPRMRPALLALALLAALAGVVSAEVYFEERFTDDSWSDRWVKSDWHVSDGTAGSFTRTAGKWYSDAEADAGVQTGPDARFYAMSADMGQTVTNEGKPLVLQFSAKHEQNLDCGGGYIKLFPSTSDMKSMGGDTKYAIMFGPDICGHATKRVHVILANKHDRLPANLMIKDDIECKTDTLTHVYTLILYPNNTYVVKVDDEAVSTGSVEEMWDFLPPKVIKDPAATKPEDWDDRPHVPDEDDVKPDGYDDVPESIVDPDASKPADWDEEEDGEWISPTMPNPEYKGPWRQKTKPNPEYKGPWVEPTIPNPDYETDDSLYKFDDLRHVGFELWQVKAGTIFDNILVTDDPAYASKFAQETWGAMKDGEKAMMDEVEQRRQKAEADEALAKAAADAAKAKEDTPEDAAADDEDDDDDADYTHDEL